MPENSHHIETLDSGVLVVRNDGFLSNAIENSLLYNSSTGFGTSARDSSTQTRVGAAYILSEQELRWLYRSSWFIRRVCDLPAIDMTKKSIQLVIKNGGDEEDSQKILSRWRSPILDVSPFSRRASYGFDQAKADAERWARQFGGAYIVLKLNRDEDPREPLEEVRSLDDIAVLDSYSMRPSDMDSNRSDPEFYQLIYDRHNRLDAKPGQLIHESRVLPYYGNKIHPYDQQVGDAVADSIVQSMWTIFCSHGEVRGTIQDAIKSFSLLTVSISNLSQLLSAGKEAEVEKFLKQVGLQKSLYRILVTDPEASKTGFEGRNLSGVRDNFEIFRDELTAASGLPYYKLWGTLGKAGLSDSGANEARAYAEQNTTAQQTKHLSNDERIIKVLSQLELGDIPGSFEVRYPSIYEETEQERQEKQKTTAEIYQIYSTIPGVVAPEEFRKAIATGEPLETVIDLDDAMEEDPPEKEKPLLNDSQREDYSYVRKIVKWRGLELGLEYLPGDRRFNKKMKAAYGHIRKHIGADGEALDCYVSKRFLEEIANGELPSYPLFRIEQLSRDDGDFDEHKYIIGAHSLQEAESLYRAHMPSWAFGGVELVTMKDVIKCRKCDSEVAGTIRSLAESHNILNDLPCQRADVETLIKVYERGINSHRNDSVSPSDWAMGRVTAFLRLLATGKPKNKKYTQDNDLLPKAHKRSTRKDGDILVSGELLADEEWNQMATIEDQDVLSLLGEALE